MTQREASEIRLGDVQGLGFDGSLPPLPSATRRPWRMLEDSTTPSGLRVFANFDSEMQRFESVVFIFRHRDGVSYPQHTAGHPIAAVEFSRFALRFVEIM